jgi:hypothetical protein
LKRQAEEIERFNGHKIDLYELYEMETEVRIKTERGRRDRNREHKLT